MMASRAMTVTYLQRRKEGGLSLGDLSVGESRLLTREEIDLLEGENL
jgi:16S rRNA U516 pseudouridylate synthase RsuA-like enzyme